MVSFTSCSSILPGTAETHRDFRFLNTLQANLLPRQLALQRVFLLQSKSPLVRCLTWMCRNPPACSSTQTPGLAHKDKADARCPPLHSSLCTYLCHGSFRLAFSLICLEMCCITLPSICTPELDRSQAKHSPPLPSPPGTPQLPPAASRPPLPGATGQRLT